MMRSSASVSTIGDVVSVSTDVPSTRNASRKVKKNALRRPVIVIVIFQTRTSTSSPPVMNRFSTAVKITIHFSGFSPRARYLIGMRARRATKTTSAAVIR